MWILVFPFGGFWFWTILAVFLILMIRAVENDPCLGLATFEMFLLIVALIVFGELAPLFKWMFHNPLPTLSVVGMYFVVGAAWSILKWSSYVRGLRRKYDIDKRTFLAKQGLPEDIVKKGKVPEKFRKDWWETGKIQHSELMNEGHLSPKRHKDDLTVWFVYWPFSLLWTVINDPIRRLAECFYEQLYNTFSKIANKAAKGVNEDVPEHDERYLPKRHTGYWIDRS